jgi:hypothetical protein
MLPESPPELPPESPPEAPPEPPPKRPGPMAAPIAQPASAAAGALAAVGAWRALGQQVLIYRPDGALGGTFTCSLCQAQAWQPDLLQHTADCSYRQPPSGDAAVTPR